MRKLLTPAATGSQALLVPTFAPSQSWSPVESTRAFRLSWSRVVQRHTVLVTRVCVCVWGAVTWLYVQVCMPLYVWACYVAQSHDRNTFQDVLGVCHTVSSH